MERFSGVGFEEDEPVFSTLKEVNSPNERTENEYSDLPTRQSSCVKTEDLIICLFGCFNPVHTQHVRLLVESRAWFEENTHFRVVATYMVIGSDGMVLEKAAKDQDPVMIRFEHRRRLCEAAIRDYPWISVYPTTGFSQKAIPKILRAELKLPHAQFALLFGTDRFFHKEGYKHVRGLTGSDFFAACVGRKGMTEQQRCYFDMYKGLQTLKGYVVLPIELENVSSTGIRNELRKIKNSNCEPCKARMLRKIVDKGWISESQSEYMFMELSNMFMKTRRPVSAGPELPPRPPERILCPCMKRSTMNIAMRYSVEGT